MLLGQYLIISMLLSLVTLYYHHSNKKIILFPSCLRVLASFKNMRLNVPNDFYVEITYDVVGRLCYDDLIKTYDANIFGS